MITSMLTEKSYGLLLLIPVLGLAACTEATPIGGGAGGDAASGNTAAATGTTGNAATTGTTSTGSGGSGGAGGGSTSTGAVCHGDPTSWTEITAAPIACTKNSDCCVVINGCLSEAQVVHADDFATAGAAWPYCDSDCNDCIPPVIDVGCVDGVCVGDAQPEDGTAGMDHCGEDVAPLVPVDPALSFTCGG